MDKFWMVWNIGNRAPTIKHPTEQSARTEAERLAKMNPGQQFAVLEATAVCETVKPIHWHALASPLSERDIPF